MIVSVELVAEPEAVRAHVRQGQSKIAGRAKQSPARPGKAKAGGGRVAGRAKATPAKSRIAAAAKKSGGGSVKKAGATATAARRDSTGASRPRLGSDANQGDDLPPPPRPASSYMEQAAAPTTCQYDGGKRCQSSALAQGSAYCTKHTCGRFDCSLSKSSRDTHCPTHTDGGRSVGTVDSLPVRRSSGRGGGGSGGGADTLARKRGTCSRE